MECPKIFDGVSKFSDGMSQNTPLPGQLVDSANVEFTMLDKTN